MVAPTKSRIVCQAFVASEPVGLNAGRYKPSALVPWADPYIAGLVRRLQSEVRFARAEAPQPQASHLETVYRGSSVTVRRLVAAPRADLEPPSPAVDTEWEGWDLPRWSEGGDVE